MLNSRLHPHMIRALFKRDLRLYFSNPTGYVFVTLFIFLSAAAAFWQRRFFLSNLANLDQLNHVFPFLLLFFIPALTMGVWADERRQGTDELLLTLPASELDLVLGKYLAAVGVYTVSLVLSLSHVLVLVWLGDPDPGLMAANYFGYWLAGVSLVAAGMVASLLATNASIAYILGALVCAVPILMDTAAALFSKSWGDRLAPLGLFRHVLDFTQGVIPLTGLVYFATLAAFSLYVNVVLLGRRHWPRTASGVPMPLHQAVRATAILVAAIACGALVSRLQIRVDATAERLHSLGGETRRTIQELPADRPVFIQAFVSPEVPELYVQPRQNLLNVLGEIASLGVPKVQVLVTETDPYSEAARHARERFGITARPVSDVTNPQAAADGIFLGMAVTSGAEEQVIPFLDRGLSVEYEIIRAIRVVARTARKRLGVIDTDAKVLGGNDPETGRPRPAWAVAGELAKQYEIIQIKPSAPVVEKVDALLVVLPSTLLQTEMDNVRDAILGGTPALVIIDPVTSMDMRLSPAAPMFARTNPYRTNEPIVQKNFGNIQQMMADIGVAWPPARIVWDNYNPHPDMARMPPEVVFVGKGSGSSEPFNPRHAAAAGLQELMLPYAGYLEPADTGRLILEPIVRTSRSSGTVGYFQLVQPTPQGPVVNTALAHTVEQPQEYVLAAHVRSRSDTSQVNAIVIADLDFISDQVFEIRALGASNANFDNIAFFLNCLDVVSGDPSFIDLRKRRLQHRTLARVEVQTRAFAEKRAREEQQADREAQQALADARNRLKARIEEIQKRTDLDEQAKQMMARNVEAVENRRLDALAANIELAKQAKIQASRENMEAEVRRIQSTIRTVAVAWPPVPVFALGVFIFVRRLRREREGAAAVRRLRGVA